MPSINMQTVLLALGAIVPAFAAPTASTAITARQEILPFEPAHCYVLRNNYGGDSKVLDAGATLGMQDWQAAGSGAAPASQTWQLVSTQHAGYYRLENRQDGYSKAVDVVNDKGVDSTTLAMADSGDFSGQYWAVEAWGDGTYKMTNLFTGPEKHFDVYSDTYEAFLDVGSPTGQHWYFTEVSCLPTA